MRLILKTKKDYVTHSEDRMPGILNTHKLYWGKQEQTESEHSLPKELA